MAVSSYRCDSYRLRLSLEDRLSDSEQSELATHLESCAFCRHELERLAAASQLWGEARLLSGEAEPDAPPTVGLAPGTSEAEGAEADLADSSNPWLEFLDPPLPDQPETLGRLGPYQVIEVLGQGGMGVVLKAHDPALDRTVAIKVLTPALAHGATARRRFAREARAVAAVGHEHIVAIHAVDEFRGLPYLVMQYIPGRSLQERLDATGPLEVKEILRVGTQAARALAAAHAQGVVHRDIKPANILLENCIERVKLTDFGLARAIDDASLTQSGVIAGTPQYMAPEQARGEPVDARSDLFSLALYSMRWLVADRRSGPTRRWPCSSASVTTGTGRSVSSTPTSTIGSKPSSTACSPSTRPTASRPPPRSPTCWSAGWPTSSSRRPFRAR